MDRSVAQGGPPDPRPRPWTNPTTTRWISLLVGILLALAAMAIYLATRTDRYYDHFVRQAVAFLEGHAAIRYPVEASGSLHRNAYFQDVLSIATTDGVLSYQRLDEALETMAEFADIKHSTKTAELAAAASQSACFPEPDVVTLRSAGLAHDLGRVGSRTGSGRGGGRCARPSGNAFVCMHT